MTDLEREQLAALEAVVAANAALKRATARLAEVDARIAATRSAIHPNVKQAALILGGEIKC